MTAAYHDVALVITSMGHVCTGVGSGAVVPAKAEAGAVQAEHEPVLLPLALQAAGS